jgi:hypothetical protein
MVNVIAEIGGASGLPGEGVGEIGTDAGGPGGTLGVRGGAFADAGGPRRLAAGGPLGPDAPPRRARQAARRIPAGERARGAR